MKEFTVETIPFTVDDRDYTIEFTREAIKAGDSMKIMEMGYSDIVYNLVYLGLKKNHPHITASRARDLVDKLLEVCSLKAFAPIIDEYTRCYSAFFQDGDDALPTRKNQATKAAK